MHCEMSPESIYICIIHVLTLVSLKWNKKLIHTFQFVKNITEPLSSLSIDETDMQNHPSSLAVQAQFLDNWWKFIQSTIPNRWKIIPENLLAEVCMSAPSQLR